MHSTRISPVRTVRNNGYHRLGAARKRPSQAVRLPKEFRMEGDKVHIRKQGAAVILEPLATDWRWLDDIAGKFSEDFFAGGRNSRGDAGGEQT